jgi:hypothetical protein
MSAPGLSAEWLPRRINSALTGISRLKLEDFNCAFSIPREQWVQLWPPRKCRWACIDAAIRASRLRVTAPSTNRR